MTGAFASAKKLLCEVLQNRQTTTRLKMVLPTARLDLEAVQSRVFRSDLP
jgi:hypothetical protein